MPTLGEDLADQDQGEEKEEVHQEEEDQIGLEDEFSFLQEDLEVTVFAVSKREEPLATVPATVTVLRHSDFERHGWANVAEALRSVPGMYMSWGRDYYYPGVRGISLPGDPGTRILVLLDGHTINNPWSAASDLGELLTLPPEVIDHVEIIRGPASSMYGSNAFLAVVNIVSQQPKESETTTSLLGGLGWGSLDQNRGLLSGRHRFGDELDVSMYGLVVGGEGPTVKFADMTRPQLNRPKPTPSNGLTSGTDFERGYNLGALASFRGLSLQLHWSDRQKGLPSAPAGAIFDDPYNSLRDTHGFAELRYRVEINDNLFLARLYYDLFRNRQFLHRDPTDWAPGTWFSEDPHTTSEGNDDTFGVEIQGTLRLHAKDTLVVGAELQRHEVTQPTFEIDLASGEPLRGSVHGGTLGPNEKIEPILYWNAALYAENNWHPLQKLGIVVGLRFDSNSIFTQLDDAGGVAEGFSPRVAVLFSPVPELNLKLMYGEAFRNPSLFEAFFDDAASVCGNSRARPERLRTLELAGSYTIEKEITATAAFFYTHMNNLLEKQKTDACYQGSGPRMQYVNRGVVTVLGGEAALSARLSNGVNAFANLSISLAERETAGSSGRPPNSPVAVASAGVSIPLWEDKLFLSAQGTFVSQRQNWTLDENQPETSHLRVDAALSARRILTGLFASLTVTNALDEPYRDPVSSNEIIPTAIPQNGVALFLKVGHEW